MENLNSITEIIDLILNVHITIYKYEERREFIYNTAEYPSFITESQ